MSYEQILYEVTDPVATITLNRPEALNAWTPQMGAELRHAAGRAEPRPCGRRHRAHRGGRGFCAGADMKMLAGIGDAASGEAGGALRRSPARRQPGGARGAARANAYFLSFDKPVIAAINGRSRAWACRWCCRATSA